MRHQDHKILYLSSHKWKLDVTGTPYPVDIGGSTDSTVVYKLIMQ